MTPNNMPSRKAPAMSVSQVTAAKKKLQNRFNNVDIMDAMRNARRHGHTGWNVRR